MLENSHSANLLAIEATRVMSARDVPTVILLSVELKDRSDALGIEHFEFSGNGMPRRVEEDLAAPEAGGHV